MTAAYFVCGMQLVFITTHLPSYLLICGMDPMLECEDAGRDRRLQRAGLAVLRLGRQRWNKACLAGRIYFTRSMVSLVFMLPPSEASTLVFGALMGFLWLGVGPWWQCSRRDVRLQCRR